MPRKSVNQEESKIVNLRMQPALVAEIDDLVARKGYMSRSEFILSAVRYYMDRVAYREEYLQRMQERGMIKEIPPPPENDED
ncbi:MAG: ribbon-helix-helix protein, CopG family [Methanomassiliicoccus sp.]|nr:ribbon-helix-helix protein, CopG family [Methanomassiliicoccus sp.]